MMKLRIQLFGRLGVNLGSNLEITFDEAPTIRDVINKLIHKDPSLRYMLLKDNELTSGTILLINGHIVDKSALGLERKLDSEDHILIDQIGFLEIVGGGQKKSMNR